MMAVAIVIMLLMQIGVITVLHLLGLSWTAAIITLLSFVFVARLVESIKKGFASK